MSRLGSVVLMMTLEVLANSNDFMILTLIDAHQELMVLVLKCFYKNTHVFHLTVPEIKCLERT